MTKNDFHRHTGSLEERCYFGVYENSIRTNFYEKTSTFNRKNLKHCDRRDFFNMNSNCDHPCCSALNFYNGYSGGCSCMYGYGAYEELPISACHNNRKITDVLKLKAFQKKLNLDSKDELSDCENSQNKKFKDRINKKKDGDEGNDNPKKQKKKREEKNGSKSKEAHNNTKSMKRDSSDERKKNKVKKTETMNGKSGVKSVALLHGISSEIINKKNHKNIFGTDTEFDALLRNARIKESLKKVSKKIPFEITETDEESEKNSSSSTSCNKIFLSKYEEPEKFKNTKKVKKLDRTKRIKRLKKLKKTSARLRSIEGNKVEIKFCKTKTSKSRKRNSSSPEITKKGATYLSHMNSDSDANQEIESSNVENSNIRVNYVIKDETSEVTLPKMLLVFQDEKTTKSRYYPILEIPLSNKIESFSKINTTPKKGKNRKKKFFRIKSKYVPKPKEYLQKVFSHSQSSFAVSSLERRKKVQNYKCSDSSGNLTENKKKFKRNSTKAKKELSNSSFNFEPRKLSDKKSFCDKRSFNRRHKLDEISSNNYLAQKQHSRSSRLSNNKYLEQHIGNKPETHFPNSCEKHDAEKEKQFIKTFYALHDKILKSRLDNSKQDCGTTNPQSQPALHSELSKFKRTDGVVNHDSEKIHFVEKKLDEYLESKNKILEHINSLYRKKKNLEQEFKNSEKNFESFVSDNIAVLFPKAASKNKV